MTTALPETAGKMHEPLSRALSEPGAPMGRALAWIASLGLAALVLWQVLYSAGVITVGFETPTRWTISPVPAPSAAASTILARITSPAGIDGDLSHRSSSARSRGDTSTPAVNAMDDDPTE